MIKIDVARLDNSLVKVYPTVSSRLPISETAVADLKIAGVEDRTLRINGTFL